MKGDHPPKQPVERSKEEYCVLLENASDAIILADTDGNLLDANKKAEELFGYTKNEFLKMRFADLHPEEERERSIEAFEGGLKVGRAVLEDVRAVRKDGKIIIVDATGSLVEFAGRKVALVILRDITERKNLMEALKESEEMYKMLVRTSPDAVIVTDLEGNIIYVSQRMLELSGISRIQEILGRSLLKLIVKEEQERMKLTLQKILNKGFVRNLEYKFVRKGSKVFVAEVNISLIKNAQGIPKAFIAVARDITERKQMEEDLRRVRDELEKKVEERTAELEITHRELQAEYIKLKEIEEALRESEEKYRDLVEKLPQTVFEVNQKGNITYANRAALKSTGYTKEDIDGGLNLLQLFVPEDRERTEQNKQKILGGYRSKGNEYIMLRKDGSRFPAMVYSSAIMRKNKPVGIRGIVMDLTGRKKMEDDLRESKDLLSGILATSPVGIGLVEDRKLSWANESMVKMFGAKRKDDYLGRDARKIYASEEEYKRVGEIIYKGSKEKVVQLDAKLKRQDGSTFDGHIMLHILDTKNPTKRVVATITDISWRKRAEKALRESEEKLRCFMQSAPDIFSLWDSELNLVEVNDIGIKMFPKGVGKKNIIGKNMKELIPSITKTGRYKKYLKIIKTGKPIFFEDIVPDRKFGKKRLSVKAFKVGNGLGIISTDITEQKFAEKELMDSKKTLYEQNILLQQKNIALKEVLEQVEKEKKEIQERVIANVDRLVIPIVNKLKSTKIRFRKDYLSLLEQNLNILTSSFGKSITLMEYRLTPREIEICNMLRGGFTSKQISEFLNLSRRTVEAHRNNIRKKLGITKSKINIVSYLRSL